MRVFRRCKICGCTEKDCLVILVKLDNDKYGFYNGTGDYSMAELRSLYPWADFVVDTDISTMTISDGENEPV